MNIYDLIGEATAYDKKLHVPKTVLMSKTALTPTPGARTTAMR